MSIYLKQFETQAAYEAAESGLILPNVSLTLDNNAVHYKPSSPTPSHDYVEIGGVKWATMNVGATEITDTGLYFQWGDISGYTASQVGSGEGQKYFDWADYKYCSGAGTSSSAITKYNSTDGKTVLDAEDDAVTAAWGGTWRMPTIDEYSALDEAITTAWTTDYQGSGVSGLVLTDKTDSSKVLFFPACGRCIRAEIDNVGKFGFYWSRSVKSYSTKYAWRSTFYYGGMASQDSDDRDIGFPVRAVVNE